MRILLVYSSLTGNTRKVAEAMSKVLPGVEMFNVKDAPEPEAWDAVLLGYWVRRGKPDDRCLAYMEKVRGKQVALFGTHGTWPNSDHACRCVHFAEDVMRAGGNTVFGVFQCQGKINPKLAERMPERVRKTHPMTEERRRRHEEAALHPDEKDLALACEFAKKWRHHLEHAEREVLWEDDTQSLAVPCICSPQRGVDSGKNRVFCQNANFEM